MKKTIRALLITTAFVILSGCSGVFQPPEQEPAAPGTGRVLVSIGDASAARTFLPAALSSPVYSLTFSASGKADIGPSLIASNTTEQELEEGTWTLDVKAYLDQNDVGDPAKVVAAATETVSVSPGGAKTVQVSLFPVQTETGSGTLSYTITLPSTSPASASLTIEKLSGEAASPVVKDLLEDAESYAGSVSLTPGTYRLTVKLSDGTGKYARWTGIAQVCQNLETAASYGFGDDPFSGSFFTDVAALSSWLAGADANTASDPYPVSLALEDFASLAGTGGGLHGVFEALQGRSVALDLSEGAAAAIPAAAGSYTPHADRDKITAITLPSSLETIGDYGLAGLSGVTSLTIPAAVTTIGRAAFAGSGIAGFAVDGAGSFTADGPKLLEGTTLVAYPSAAGSITLAEAVIGPGALAGSALTRITIAGAVTNIGAGAFANCAALQTVRVLSETPPALGDGAFDGARGNLAIIVPAGKSGAYKVAPGWSAHSDAIEEAAAPFTSLNDMQTYLATAPGGTDKNNPIEVALAVNLADLDDSNSASYAMRLFYESIASSSKYVSVDLSSCTGAFGTGTGWSTTTSRVGHRQWLVAVTLPAHITAMSRHIFRECVNLVTVDLSKCSSLTAISNRAFSQLSFLETIDLSGCSSLTTIDDSAFSSTTSLKEITLGPSVTTVGGNAFSGCSGLRWIKWPQTQASSISIPTGSFNGLSRLARLELPDASISVGVSAISTGPIEVLVLHGQPPPIAFLTGLSWAASYTIYVPDEAIDTYKSSQGWMTMQDHIKSLSELDPGSPDHPDNW
jgi:uncharacterized protein YceK